MSWDTYLVIDTGGEELAEVADLGNYTYNVAPMYYDVFGNLGLRLLDGLLAKNAIPILKIAINELESNPSKYRAMEPENEWGNYEGAVRYLKVILRGCMKHPKATIHIC